MRRAMRAVVDYAVIFTIGSALWNAYGWAWGLASMTGLMVYSLWVFWDGCESGSGLV